MLSNFPVWIFDVYQDPKRPTFGFKLIGGKGAGGGLDRIVKAFGWPVQMGVDIFHTTTDAWDTYWVENSTYVRTCAISAGDIGTTDFTLREEQKNWLLESGRTAARSFLDSWNRTDYVNGRGKRLNRGAAAPAAQVKP